MLNLGRSGGVAKIPAPVAATESVPAFVENRNAPLPRLALVVPTLREAGNIRILLRRVRATLDAMQIEYNLIVVDDDSRDGIEAIVGEIAEADPRVRIVVREGRRGLAGAVIHGWRHSEAEILGVMDADLQHPPELLSRLWHQVAQGADLAVGSRYAAGGSLGEWNLLRRLISRLAIWVTLPLQRASARSHDPMSGFFLVRRSCIRDLELQTTGFKILLEILVRGNVRNLAEVYFDFGTRRTGASKASIKVAIDYAALLFRLYRWRRSEIGPLPIDRPENA